MKSKVFVKNEQQIHTKMAQWCASGLLEYGVTETGFLRYDIKKNQYIGNSTNCLWRDEFHEQALEATGVHLLKEGCFILPQNSVIKEAYNGLTETPESYKTLFVLRDEAVFTVFGVVTDQLLGMPAQAAVNRKIHQLSFELERFLKGKTTDAIYQDIPQWHLAQEMLLLATDVADPTEIIYDKAKFSGNLILTGKEQKYIECLILGMTHRQIAQTYQVSETAVSGVIKNIRRKLNMQEGLSHFEMMLALKERGVLGIYADALNPQKKNQSIEV